MFAEKIVHCFLLNVRWIVEISSHSPTVYRSRLLRDRINKSKSHQIPIPIPTSKGSTMAPAASEQLPPGVSPIHPLGPLKELIDELHTFTRNNAKDSHSDDLGVRTITAGDISDALVPVFFRCTWPEHAKTRHILIWVKPSIPSQVLGEAVNNAFRVVEAGGIFTKTRAIWAGENPFAASSPDGIAAREMVRRTVGLDDIPTEKQIIKMMEGTMNGIMQVVVEPARDALKCFICHEPRPITQENLDNIRKSTSGLTICCENCIQKLGRQEIDRIQGQAMAEAKQRARNSLSNPSG